MPKRRGDLATAFNQYGWTVIGECWMWDGPPGAGYGRVHGMGAHRASYLIHHGPIPDGQHVLHSCDTPGCVSPDHLSAGTHQDNMRDRNSRGRTAIGEQSGHKLTESEVQAILASSDSTRTLARRYGVSNVQVGRIKRGESWSHLLTEGTP